MRVISRITDSVNVDVLLAASIGHLGECVSNELRRAARAAARVESGLHGAFRVRTRIAERHQRAHGVFRGAPAGAVQASRPLGASTGGEIVHLLRQIQNQLLGFLAADPGHALQRRDVLLANRAHEPVRRKRRHHPDGERRTHPFRVEDTLKDAALEGAGEAEKLPVVFLDDEVGVQRARLADSGERLVHPERDDQLVSDAAGGHDLDAVDVLAEERTGDLRDHYRARAATGSRCDPITYARAAATPSAASEGFGADFRRSSRVSMNCTCSFVAAPEPTTDFLISAGDISCTRTPACCPARSMTPRACPRVTVVRTLRA